MISFAKQYQAASLGKRLFFGIGAAVVLNAVYCLIYRYTSGNRATLFEAFAWGIINIAPWVAAFEIGRASRNWLVLTAIFAAAVGISLLLEAVLFLSWPTSFDLVRRIPAALLIAATLAVLVYLENRREVKSPELELIGTEQGEKCDWVMTAGNYVEMHQIGAPVRLVRSSLTRFIVEVGPGFVRVHRRYAIRLSSVRQCERTHIVLRDGTRVPIGDRYRAKILNGNLLIPSSQTT